MVITDIRQKPSTIDFADLEYGDVFQDEDGDICMKIESDYSHHNAVVLTTGVAFECGLDAPVIPLYAGLTINNK